MDMRGADLDVRASELVKRFHRARADGDRVVLEGFHPLKHALRFGAAVDAIVTFERERLLELARDHAPELAGHIDELATEIPRREFKRLGPYEPHTGVVSIADRVHHDAQAMLASGAPAPLVMLEQPQHRGNIGAVVRVAAAAQAAGVLISGPQDPWHSVVVRGSAGLHYAVAVARIDALPSREELEAAGRPLVVLDPEGEGMRPGEVPRRALLAFGSERSGVSEELRRRADVRLRLPMREGVSSLNLATCVAAVLYAMKLAEG